MGVSLSPIDSSFILLTSCETCTASISGKLRHNSENLQASRARDDLRKGESGEYLVHNIAVGQVVTDIHFSLLLEGWYIVLGAVSQRDAQRKRGWLPCPQVCKSTSLTEMGVFLWSNPHSLPVRGAENWDPN